MYDVLDEDKSGFISFKEFMNYVLILQRGSKHQKTEFIFKLICPKSQDYFTFEDLKVFYAMINQQYEGHHQSSSQDGSEDSICFDEEQEMAAIVFEIMQINVDKRVDLKKFQNFLHSNTDFQNLFNFLSVDAEKSRIKIKEKQNLNYLENLVEDITQDIDDLERLCSSESVSLNNLNQKQVQRKNKFAALFQKVVKIHIDQNRKKSSERSSTLNDIINSRIFNKNLPKQDKNYESRKSLNSVFQQIKRKIQKINNWIGRELQQFEKKERFEQNIRKSVSQKKQNQEIIFLTNPNWNIAVSMVKGITKSINIIQNDQHHSIGLMDFKINNKIEMESIFSTAFNKFKFKDYCPHVFQSLRRESGIRNDAYIQSIGYKTFQDAFFEKLNFMLSENSTGKSGSFFFHTADHKYMIKTIKKNEFQILIKQLPAYYKYILENPDTLLPRYYGLHGIQCYQNTAKKFDLYIVVMNNVFRDVPQDVTLKVYDLKGSFYKRLTCSENMQNGEAGKDQNFVQENQKLKIKDEERDKIIFQLLKDSQFLATNQIMDYSFLLGVDKASSSKYNNQDKNPKLRKNPTRAKLRFNQKNQINSIDSSETYYFGIIDTLTYYGVRKKAEYLFKRMIQGKGISCVPPISYQQRFMRFMSKNIITKNNQLDIIQLFFNRYFKNVNEFFQVLIYLFCVQQKEHRITVYIFQKLF